MHGRDDVGVGAASADVAVHSLLDVVIGRPDVLLQDRNSGHNLAGGAIAALIAVMLDESGLHRMEMVGLTDPFDGCDLVGLMHDSEGKARVDAAAIDVDGAVSALAVVATLLRAGKV